MAWLSKSGMGWRWPAVQIFTGSQVWRNSGESVAWVGLNFDRWNRFGFYGFCYNSRPICVFEGTEKSLTFWVLGFLLLLFFFWVSFVPWINGCLFYIVLRFFLFFFFFFVFLMISARCLKGYVSKHNVQFFNFKFYTCHFFR